jgi:hypothetical protein
MPTAWSQEKRDWLRSHLLQEERDQFKMEAFSTAI